MTVSSEKRARAEELPNYLLHLAFPRDLTFSYLISIYIALQPWL